MVSLVRSSEDRWLLELALLRERLTFLVAPDIERNEKALVHTGPFALSHLERDVPASFRDALAEIALSLRASDPRSIEELCELIERSGVRASIRRRIPKGSRVPFWPVSIRSGSSSRSELWPFDAELAALRIGRRRLVRREGLDEAQMRHERTYLEGHDLHVRWVGAPHGTLLASPDPSVLAEAAEREAANVSAGAEWQQAARWNGDALGYPSCCVEAFVRIRRRDELMLFAERLPPIVHEPALPHSQWLDGALALVSHAPCDPSCDATLALAAEILAELERTREDFATRWLRLARRVHVIDLSGTCLALDVEGPLDGGLVREAHAITLDPVSSLPRVDRRPDLFGVRLSIDAHLLVGAGHAEFGAALVSDHRHEPPAC